MKILAEAGEENRMLIRILIVSHTHSPALCDFGCKRKCNPSQ